MARGTSTTANSPSPCGGGSARGEAWAECLASLLNARLVAEDAGVDLAELLPQVGLPAVAPTPGGVNPESLVGPQAAGLSGINVPKLRQIFIGHHEKVLGSAVGTVSRYSTATLYLERYVATLPSDDAMAVSRDGFITYLRNVEISPNGHPNAPKRRLREKGIRFIPETSRSMYHSALRQGLIPRHLGNPFADASIARIRVRDAKPIFLFTPQAELAFFTGADRWSFAIHFTLAKTGLRRGELRHLLIEDLDLENGWLHVRGKPELGWNVKTNRERRVPLLPELVDLLRNVIGTRKHGPVFLRAKLQGDARPALFGDRSALVKAARVRLAKTKEEKGRPLTRAEEARVLERVWQDAGAIDPERIRSGFIRAAKKAGLGADATCPKSWRHTFATLMQEANVDLLVRQETLGHRPSSPEMSALGMTGVYTHTTPGFQRTEIERALRLRPRALSLIRAFIEDQKADKEVSHECR